MLKNAENGASARAGPSPRKRVSCIVACHPVREIQCWGIVPGGRILVQPHMHAT